MKFERENMFDGLEKNFRTIRTIYFAMLSANIAYVGCFAFDKKGFAKLKKHL